MKLPHASLLHEDRTVIVLLVCLWLACTLTACSSQKSSTPSASVPMSSSQTEASAHPGRTLKTVSDADLSGMSSDELATYVFANHGCKNCHTLGKGGKLGFTERGKEVGKNFEGCIRLLTTMNVVAQTRESDRTPEEKEKAVRFQEFGCTTCHQITPGKPGLTEYGAKLASLHMACTDVERILSQKAGQ